MEILSPPPPPVHRSYRQGHRFCTGDSRQSLGKDPSPPSRFDELEDIPAVQLLRLVLHQLFGWPLYLLFNATAGNNSLPRTGNHSDLPRYACNMFRQSHFGPFSAVFRPSEAAYVLLSDIGVGLMLAALYYSWLTIGSLNLMLIYGQPYFWVHHWLSMTPNYQYQADSCEIASS
jgi:hypothetical protein